MSDVSGAAEAAPAPAPAPAPESAPALPATPAKSAREAVDRAFVGLEKDEAQPPRPIQSTTQPVEKPEAKPQAKAEKPVKAEAKAVETKTAAKPEAKAAPEAQPRTERGQFAPKNEDISTLAGQVDPQAPAKPTSYADPPARFSADAKTAWADAPEPIRAEIHRAVKELEQGYQKYKGDAEAYAEVKSFADLAKQTGTTLQAAMSNYVGIEQKLKADPIAGFEQIARNLGLSFRDIAAHVMGQKPDQAASRTDATIRELQQTVQQLRQQVGGVTKTIEQQRSEGAMSHVASFAAEPGHERFEELAQDIKFFVESGRATDLNDAYTLAERLNPGPAPAPVAKPEAAQPRKGALAVHGAPSSGSDPATKKPPSSARAAVDGAFAALGLG